MNNLIFIMYERGFGWNLVRSLFSWLDSVAYTLFSWVMQLIFDIAQVSVSDAFDTFYSGIQERIYALLAIYMLFKITISMLTYLVNPDSISDKSSGVGKLSIRIVTSLVMLIAFPMAFNFLKTVQPHIMEALPRIILASEVGNTDLGSQMENVGKNIAFQTYNGVFFNTSCADLEESGKCFAFGNTVDDAVKFINEPVPGDDDSYRYDYMPLVGFVVALVMTLILLGYCVDVAIRVFKLIILQLIAPIPIISYMDPKSSKDGAFNKWIKMVISVWADLFIKLAIIYFVMLAISELFTSGSISDVTSQLFGANVFRGGLVTLALIVGLLFFAKDAPKFIGDALGIKMGENGKLFGGLGKIMAAGAIGAGAIGASIAAGRASRMADVENGINDKNKFVRGLNRVKNVGAGLLGGAAGIGAGYSAALSAKDHHSKAALDAISKRNANLIALGGAGSTALGRMQESASQLLTGETLFERQKRKLEPKEKFAQAAATFDKNLKAEAIKGKYGQISVSGGGNYIYDQDITGNSKSLRAQAQVAISNGDEYFYYDNGSGVTAKVSTTDYETIASDMEKAEMELLYSEFAAGRDHDNADLYQEYITVTESGNSLHYNTSSRKNLDNSRKAAAAEVSEVKRSARYQAGEVNSKAAKK